MHQHQPHCLRSLPDLWFAADKTLKHAVFKMQLGEPNPRLKGSLTRPDTGAADLTASLSDEHLLRILALVPEPLRLPASLVCKRWLRLVGRLRRSLTLVDWSFLDRRRLYLRFPDITDLDLVPASLATSYDGSISRGSVLLSKGTVSVPVDIFSEPPVNNCSFFEPDAIDRGLVNVAHYYPGLQKLSLVAGSLEAGLMAVAQACDILQELDIHRCSDLTLRPISAFKNLQILRLVGSIEGLYHGPSVTDIGLTLLAHGCKRLVKLELVGCEGSYDGISAIGRCCEMLEELTISDHRMDAGWMAGLSFCRNLKTLSLHSCKRIDADPGPMEHLGTCPTIQTLQFQQCQLRDKRSLQALFMLCDAVRDVVFEKCWGLDNDMFSVASTCRNVKFLSLEGCSLLTTEGLESVVLSWIDLQRLVVISCNNIKDYEVSPALSNLFSVLKEFKWRPDSKSLRYTSLAGTGMGKKGGRFFKWA